MRKSEGVGVGMKTAGGKNVAGKQITETIVGMKKARKSVVGKKKLATVAGKQKPGVVVGMKKVRKSVVGMKTAGGRRVGAGRPRGSGRYREGTAALRVPNSLVGEVQDWLDAHLESLKSKSLKSKSLKSESLKNVVEKNVVDLKLEGQLCDKKAIKDAILDSQILSAKEPILDSQVFSSKKATLDSQEFSAKDTVLDSQIFSPDFGRKQTFPLYASRVAAGFPSPADDYMETKLDLNQHLVKHPAATFFVRVEGESMIGAGIHPNDMLVVDRSLKPSDGKIVIAVVNGELTVKRLKVDKAGVILMPENPKFSPIRVTEDMNFSIWGVVTNVIHSV